MERLPMVRCYTCGKVIPHLRYQELIKRMSPEEAYQKLGLRRYCCRMNTSYTPLHVTREVYAREELTKNLLPPPAGNGETFSSLPPY